MKKFPLVKNYFLVPIVMKVTETPLFLLFSSFCVLELPGNASLNPFSTLLVTTVGVTGNTPKSDGKRFPPLLL